MIVSTSRQFIFVHTMKTAGDSISDDLKPFLAREDFVLQNDFQAWRQRVARKTDPRLQPLVKHSPASAIKELLPAAVWSSFYKFAFVRHPTDRAVSLYRYVATKAEQRRRLLPRNVWYATPPGRAGDPLNWPAMRAFRETDSFSGFIRHPAMVDAAGMQPQSEFLCDPSGELLVDFVGKFERIDEDMATVRAAIGLPRGALSRRNISKPASSGPVEVSEDDRLFLAQRFEEDYSLFHYEP